MDPFEIFFRQILEKNLFSAPIFLKRNEFLKKDGETDTNIYYVEKGSLNIFILDQAQEQTIRFGYEKDLIVALDSFISEKPSLLYIQAIKASQVMKITKKQLMDLVKESEENQKLWIKILEQLILQQKEREIDILISSPLARYNRVLKRSPQLFQQIPHKYIANYLRMTPETLSRLKKS
jgi:CRP/FNR family transcriptional regulator, anaerobic regulatory protein